MQESHTGTSVRAHARTLDILPFFLARSLPRRRREESVLILVDVADSEWAARLFQKRERVREKENEQKKCMQLKLKSLQWEFAVELCVYSAKKKI